MRERVYKALIKRYESEQEDALLKVDLLLVNAGSNAIMVDHVDITGEVDTLLGKIGKAEEKLSVMRKYCVPNKAEKEELNPYLDPNTAGQPTEEESNIDLDPGLISENPLTTLDNESSRAQE